MLREGWSLEQDFPMETQDVTPFEQMVLFMRQRLRPTGAHLFADRLRTCIGLNYSRIEETRLLKMLLQEVSLSRGLAAGVGAHLLGQRTTVDGIYPQAIVNELSLDRDTVRSCA